MRPTLELCFINTAKIFAQRSTCSRLQVGCVITNEDMTNIVSIGYNGSAKGRPNECESSEPGKCGHIHSEQNALIKADYSIPNKVMFCTHSPCLPCAKLIVNAGIKALYFGEVYRDFEPLNFLADCKLQVTMIEADGKLSHWPRIKEKKSCMVDDCKDAGADLYHGMCKEHHDEFERVEREPEKPVYEGGLLGGLHLCRVHKCGQLKYSTEGFCKEHARDPDRWGHAMKADR